MKTFAFVSAERGNHAVTTLCRVIGASVSGFYAWLRAILTVQHHAEAEAELRGHIGRIFGKRCSTTLVWRVDGQAGTNGSASW